MTLTRKILSLSCFALFAFAIAARADTVNLTVDNCSGGCGTPTGLGAGVFAQVVLTQVGSNVLVTETLATGDVYAVGGAGDALVFDLSGDPALTATGGTPNVTGLTTGFTFHPAGDTISSIGAFDYDITCSGCGSGTSPPNLSGPISFTIDNILTSDFTTTDGYYFESDIGGVVGNGYNTGNVGGKVDTTGSSPVVPEPSSLLLLGTGIIGAAGLMRRRVDTARN